MKNKEKLEVADGRGVSISLFDGNLLGYQCWPLELIVLNFSELKVRNILILLSTVGQCLSLIVDFEGHSIRIRRAFKELGIDGTSCSTFIILPKANHFS